LADFRKAVMAVTQKDVQGVAAKYLQPKRMVLVAVGAIGADGKPLAKIPAPRKDEKEENNEEKAAPHRSDAMRHDFGGALQGWAFKPGVGQARLVQVRGGRQVIQVRVDLGILQLETTGRPDGARPHGQPTYFDYLRQQARAAARAGKEFIL